MFDLLGYVEFMYVKIVEDDNQSASRLMNINNFNSTKRI